MALMPWPHNDPWPCPGRLPGNPAVAPKFCTGCCRGFPPVRSEFLLPGGADLLKVQQSLLRGIRISLRTMLVVLFTFGTMSQLYTWWKLPFNAVVFAVLLSVMLPRAFTRARRSELPITIIAFAIGTAAAIGCGMLIANDNGWFYLGIVLFAAGVSAPIWVRRFGNTWKISGVLAGLPFMVILVHPLPLEQSSQFFVWELLAAAVALMWAVIMRILANRSDQPQLEPPATAKASRRLASSTKMALQLGAATVAAFGCAKLLDAEHLVWPVLTVLIVHSGNRGRGDVLWKGAQRTVGALVGVTITTLAISISNLPLKNSMIIVAIFVLLFIATTLRELGYFYWAVCITAALALLYSFSGQTGTELTAYLIKRLLGITSGSIIGIASAYFLLPIRTTEVVRLRLSALLAAANDAAIAYAQGHADQTTLEKLTAADQALSHFDSVTKAARYLGIGDARRLYGAIMNAHALVKELLDNTAPKDSAEFAALARQIGIARRQLTQNNLNYLI